MNRWISTMSCRLGHTRKYANSFRRPLRVSGPNICSSQRPLGYLFSLLSPSGWTTAICSWKVFYPSRLVQNTAAWLIIRPLPVWDFKILMLAYKGKKNGPAHTYLQFPIKLHDPLSLKTQWRISSRLSVLSPRWWNELPLAVFPRVTGCRVFLSFFLCQINSQTISDIICGINTP